MENLFKKHPIPNFAGMLEQMHEMIKSKTVKRITVSKILRYGARKNVLCLYFRFDIKKSVNLSVFCQQDKTWNNKFGHAKRQMRPPLSSLPPRNSLFTFPAPFTPCPFPSPSPTP